MLRFVRLVFATVPDFYRARPPTREEVIEDLKLLDTLSPVIDALGTGTKSSNPDAVRAYYNHTTYRDYRVLNWLGAAECMHTPLARDGPLCSPFSESVLLVLSHLRPATSVLELGCGKGANAIFLKTVVPSIEIVGVDLSPTHVQHARLRASDAGCDNSTFSVVDVGNATDLRKIANGSGKKTFETVFAIESMCYLAHDAMPRLLEWIRKHLTDGGEFVMIDGFRTETSTCMSHSTRDVTHACAELAERGFRLPRLKTMKEWHDCAEKAGLRVTMRTKLTREALPFWSRWWRLGRLLLRLPWLIRAYACAGKERRRETLASFAAVLGTAPSMALGATEYGMMVFYNPAVGD